MRSCCVVISSIYDKVIYLFSNKTYQKNIKLILETDSILIFFVTFGKYFILDFLTFKQNILIIIHVAHIYITLYIYINIIKAKTK